MEGAMIHQTIEQKLNEILELLKPKEKVAPVEEWEDVTGQIDYCGSLAFAHRHAGRFGDEIVTDDNGYRFTKIDGLHNGPAFIVERRKS